MKKIDLRNSGEKYKGKKVKSNSDNPVTVVFASDTALICINNEGSECVVFIDADWYLVEEDTEIKLYDVVEYDNNIYVFYGKDYNRASGCYRFLLYNPNCIHNSLDSADLLTHLKKRPDKVALAPAVCVKNKVVYKQDKLFKSECHAKNHWHTDVGDLFIRWPSSPKDFLIFDRKELK